MLMLLIPAIVIFWVVYQREQDTISRSVTGETEAVMTTKARVLDGVWNEGRYSDELYQPMGLTVLNGDLVIADSMCDRIQIIDGDTNKRIGKPGQYGLSYQDSGALVDGYRENALFMKPMDVRVTADGNVVICDTGNHVIRLMDDTYVTTIAGSGYAGYADGKERASQFSSPRSAVADASGIIYVADTMNHCIRRINENGEVALYAGQPGQPGYADGSALEALFYEPSGLALDGDGVLYVADAANHCVRMIHDGQVVTVAGAPGGMNDDTGYPGGGYYDGAPSEARFNFPRDIALLEDGSIVVADSVNHAVRLIKADEVITLLGGGMDGQYYAAAENLRLTRPEGVCVEDGTLYVSDTVNNRVVAVPLTERILGGRPSRDSMLKATGLSTASRYAYQGEIRVFIGDERVDMGNVQPWNTGDGIFVPITPLIEALGGEAAIDGDTNVLVVDIQGERTLLRQDSDYFILKGTAVTTVEELMRLFPYALEWFPEFSLIALYIPQDLLPEEVT